MGSVFCLSRSAYRKGFDNTEVHTEKGLDEVGVYAKAGTHVASVIILQ
jgi:hypothetical protein